LLHPDYKPMGNFSSGTWHVRVRPARDDLLTGFGVGALRLAALAMMAAAAIARRFR
jgi:hypothetical protein